MQVAHTGDVIRRMHKYTLQDIVLYKSKSMCMHTKSSGTPDAAHDVDDQRGGVEQDQEVARMVREPAHHGGQQRLPHRRLCSADGLSRMQTIRISREKMTP